ncbi:hypothetical protein FACS1894184_03470 [Clostridia bacterium]|nr:hypothetical protein FACS1894184_03470 [Clostridia bacterium]
MSRLIVLSGASNAGKFGLFTQLAASGKVIPLKKLTTRPARYDSLNNPEHTPDLLFSSKPEDVLKCEFTYLYFNNYYGVGKASIDAELSKGNFPAVNITDYLVVKNLKDCYRNTLTIYLQNVISGDDSWKEQRKRGDLLEEEERVKRQSHSLREYSNNIEKCMFDYVVLNDFAENTVRQIKYIIDKEIIHGTDDNAIFVIMSFAPIYDEIYQVYKCVCASLESIKLLRIDDKLGGYIISNEIEVCIKTAGLIICDLTDLKPNVLYELGYAMALNKYIIITAKSNTVLPFDVRNYRTVFYDNETDLQEKMITEIKNHYRY